MDFFGQAKGWLYRNSLGLLKHRNATVDGERCGQFYRNSAGLLVPYNLAGKTSADCAFSGSFFRDADNVLRTSQPFLCDGGAPPACTECDPVPTKWTLFISGGGDILGFNDEAATGGVFCSHTDFYFNQLNTSFDLLPTTPGVCNWSGTKTLGTGSRNYTNKVCNTPDCFGGTSCAVLLNRSVCDPVSESACPCTCAKLVCCPDCTCCHPLTGNCTGFCPCCCDCSTAPACCPAACPDKGYPNVTCCLNHYPPPSDPKFVTIVDSSPVTITASVSALTVSGIPTLRLSVNISPFAGPIITDVHILSNSCVLVVGSPVQIKYFFFPNPVLATLSVVAIAS